MTNLFNIEEKGQTQKDRVKEMATVSFICMYVNYRTETTYRMNFNWVNTKSGLVNSVMFETYLN
jgi:hypothetical protein